SGQKGVKPGTGSRPGAGRRALSPRPVAKLRWSERGPFPLVPIEEATKMRMRMGAPLLVALCSLFGAVQYASAQTCGAARYSGCCPPSCDAQTCFSSNCGESRPSYRLVYDNVMEKRWHTCYKTVCETVNKTVTKTCYREECKTV